MRSNFIPAEMLLEENQVEVEMGQADYSHR